jgi:hypothetical protein
MSRAEPTSTKASMAGFAIDLGHLRRNARAHIEEGPITEAYGADRDRVVAVLNEVLATELVCVLRYKRHYYMADGLESAPVAQEFLQHADEEQGHADRVAQRTAQLQGAPDFNPATLVVIGAHSRQPPRCHARRFSAGGGEGGAGSHAARQRPTALTVGCCATCWPLEGRE